MTTFILKPRPPFRLDLAVWTLRRRFENAVDQWDGGVYRRVLPMDEGPILVTVIQLPGSGSPRLSVTMHGERMRANARTVVIAALERLLGIRLNLDAFYAFAADQPMLGPLAGRFRGMKPPRFLTGFECLVNAIACQLFSLASGIRLLDRFAAGFGQVCHSDGRCQFAFPRPSDLVRTEVSDLRKIGFSQAKARAVLNLAERIRSGTFDMDLLSGLSDQAAVEELCRLRGVGRWTAEYALLRGMGRLHVFPGDDVGARNNLTRWLNLSEKLDCQRVAEILEQCGSRSRGLSTSIFCWTNSPPMVTCCRNRLTQRQNAIRNGHPYRRGTCPGQNRKSSWLGRTMRRRRMVITVFWSTVSGRAE